MKIKISLLVITLLLFGAIVTFFSVFKNSSSLVVYPLLNGKTFPGKNVQNQCFSMAANQPIDENGSFSLTSWNIYKQQNTGWSQALSDYSGDDQLVLLQETKLNNDFTNWLETKNFNAFQVNAFDVLDKSAGVMTMARISPMKMCGDLIKEPIIQLNKSTLISYYPLSNGDSLAVANIHGVNFTWGVERYHQQLKFVIQQLSTHKGPMIVAGDFNDWNVERKATVRDMIDSLSLREVSYTPDNRKRFFYNDFAIDHIFYRDLNLERASVSITDASDHAPIHANFSL